MQDYLDERVQQHDLKRALVFAASSCRTATEFRSVAERLTEVFLVSAEPDMFEVNK